MRKVAILFAVPVFFLLFSSTKSAHAQTVLYTEQAVLGQNALSQTSYNEVNNKRAMHIGGVHVDQARNRMYVYDSGNNRILGFNSLDFSNPARVPNMIFGQPNAISAGCNLNSTNKFATPSASTLCLNRGAYAISQEEEPRFSTMDTDAAGNLYVLDQYNNRVLRYNNPLATGGNNVADMVWGQVNFTQNICNRGMGVLPYPSTNLPNNGFCTSVNITASIDFFVGGAVDIDAFGNLWVTDTVNNRILRFPAVAGVPAQTADLQIGQPDMSSFTEGYTACQADPSKVCKPYVIRVNDTTKELFVLEGDESGGMQYRVAVFKPADATNPTSTYAYDREFAKGALSYPRGMVFRGTNVWISDQMQDADKNDQVRLFDGITGAQLPGTIDSTTKSGLMQINGQISLNAAGTTLYLTEQRYLNSLVNFNITNPATPTYGAELLGGPDTIWNNITAKGLGSPLGMSVHENQIFISDGYRILVWNTAVSLTNPITTGQAANYVIGQPSGTFNTPASSTLFSSKVAAHGIDPERNVLWVANDSKIFAFQLPITASNPAPLKRYISSELPISSGLNYVKMSDGRAIPFRAWSVGYDYRNDALWIADSINSKVVRVSDPYGINPTVSLVIGQDRFEDLALGDAGCNKGTKNAPTAQTVCNPSDVKMDMLGNLYVVEGVYEGRIDRPGNKRIIEFNMLDINNAVAAGVFSAPSAFRVYGVENFTTNPLDEEGFVCVTNQPCNPISVSFDPQNRMAVVGDAYFNDQNKRIFIYDNPVRTIGSGYVAFDTAFGDKQLGNSMGQGGYTAFDGEGSLYVQDHSWNRVFRLLRTPSVRKMPCTSTQFGSIFSTTLTIPFNNCATANDIAVVTVSYRAVASHTGHTISSLTYGGVNMTKVCRVNSNEYATELWYLNNPSFSSGNISATWRNGGVVTQAEDIVMTAVSYNGIDTSAPIAATSCQTDNGQWSANPEVGKNPVSHHSGSNSKRFVVATMTTNTLSNIPTFDSYDTYIIGQYRTTNTHSSTVGAPGINLLRLEWTGQRNWPWSIAGVTLRQL